MSISFSGLASGLDTSSWVESLVALKKAKVTSLEEEKKEVQSLQETLTQIKSFFSSFRSMLEKVTDAKFGVASMDLFAQNLATSSNLEALTASATTEAEEATYNVLVDKLASETKANSNYSYMTTIIQTTTATVDSKLINLGVKAGNIGVTVNGVEHGINITENDTISTFIEKLNNIGVKASYNEGSGVFSIDVGENSIRDIDSTGIVDALHLKGVNEGYTSDSLKTSTTDTIFSAATETTKLSELGVKNGTVTIHANDKDYSFTINQNTTLGGFIADLKNKNIEASLDKDGVFTITDADITNEGTTDIKNALGLTSTVYEKAQITGDLTHKTIVTQTTTATSGTLLKDLGTGVKIEDNQTVIVKNSNNETTTITVGTTTTLGQLIEKISNAGLYAALKSDGTVEIAGGTITGGTFDAEKALGLEKEPYTAIVTGKSLTETVEVHKIVTLQTKLVDDLKVKEGYLEVTDADGNKFYEKIYSGQTIADFMADMGNLGINTSLDEDTGVLTITGGAFKTLSDADVKALVANGTIRETQDRFKQGTNLLACLYGADTIATEQITVASTHSKTRALRHTVVNTIDATKTTTLGNLGLSGTGTAIFDVRGEKRTITVDKTMTVEGLMNALKNAGIASSWSEEHSKLLIENSTLTGGTSNLAGVLNLTTEVSGKYITSSELYSTDTVTIDATRATVLKDYGITNSMSEADRTVTIYNSDGTVAGSTVVTESTTIGNLLDFINSKSGISANITDGYLRVDNGYIGNATLEATMGLKTSNKSSYVLGSVMTVTTTSAVSGNTTLENIFRTIGTLDKVSGGYTLNFNSKSISVSATTTLNELISKIAQNGGNASLDATGRLSIDGGTLTGTVAEALGMTTVTNTVSVSASGQTMLVKQTIYANRDTKLSDLGVTGDTTYVVHNSLGQATTTVSLANTTSLGAFLDGLKAYQIDGVIADGVIKLDSASGQYITGDLATKLGIATQTVTDIVNTTVYSTSAVQYTATGKADLDTKLGSILAVNTSNNTLVVYNSLNTAKTTITVSATTTLDELFGTLAKQGIQAEVNNGVISFVSNNGSYVTGSIIDSFGMTTTTVTVTTTAGTTATSSKFTYTNNENAKITDKLGTFITVNGNQIITVKNSETGATRGTITVTTNTTFESMFKALDDLGIQGTMEDGVITITSNNGAWATGDVLTSLGISTVTQTVTISTTKTTGTMSTSGKFTYTNNETAKITDNLGTFITVNGNQIITVKNSETGATRGTVTVTSNTTFESMFKALDDLGIQATMEDGVITITSNNGSWATGDVLTSLGISTVTQTVTISTTKTTGTMATTGKFSYTQNETAKITDNLGTFITVNGNQIITVKNSETGATRGTITVTTNTTFESMFKALDDLGIQATMEEGVITITSNNGSWATGDVLTSLGISTVTQTVTISTTKTTGTMATTGRFTYVNNEAAKITDTIGSFITVNGNQIITVKNAETGTDRGTVTITSGTTFESLFKALDDLGIQATMEDGVITITSNQGNWVTGGILSSLGISTVTQTVTISTTKTTGTTATTGQFTYVKNENAKITDTIGSFVTVNGNQIITVKNAETGTDRGTVTITSGTTFESLFKALDDLGIQATMEDGVITITSNQGNWVTGGILSSLGISTITRTVTTTTTKTTGTTATTGQFTYVKNENAKITDTIGSFITVNGNQVITVKNAETGTDRGTVTITSGTTFESLFKALDDYGVQATMEDGVITITSNCGRWAEGAVLTSLGVSAIIQTATITTTKTVGTSKTTGSLTYTKSEAAKITDKISTFISLPTNKTITIKENQTGATVGTVTIDNNTTFESLFKALDDYGVQATMEDGVITITSNRGRWAEGAVLTSLGITAVTTVKTVTVGKTTTSTAAISYTVTRKVTDDDSVLGCTTLTVASTLTVCDKYDSVKATVTVGTTMTFGELFSVLSDYDIDGDIHDGVIKLTSVKGDIIKGDVATALGLQTTMVVTTKTVGACVSSSAQVTYTSTVAASGTTRLSNVIGSYIIDGTITESEVTGNVIGISTAQDLVNLKKIIGNGKRLSGKTFVMTQDIDMSGVSNWCNVAKDNSAIFKGVFDGQGYTISNLDLSNSSSTSDIGLFGTLIDATVKNVKLDNITAQNNRSDSMSKWCSAYFLAISATNSTISNITLSNASVNNLNCSLIGSTNRNCRIENCTVDLRWTSDDASKGHSWVVSGIVGTMGSDGVTTITGCKANLNAKGYLFLGAGIVGYQAQTDNLATWNISNCLVTGSLESDRGDVPAGSNTSICGIIGGYVDNQDGKPVKAVINVDHCVIKADLKADKGFVNYITGGIYGQEGTFINVNANGVIATGTKTLTGRGCTGWVTGGHYGELVDDPSLYSYYSTNTSTNLSDLKNFGFNSKIWDSSGNLNNHSNAAYSITINDKTGGIVDVISLSSTATVEDLIYALKPYGSATLSSDGYLSFTGNDGNYITGALANRLGIYVDMSTAGTTLVGKTLTSTAPLTYTEMYTSTTPATGTTALKDVLMAGSNGVTPSNEDYQLGIMNPETGSILLDTTLSATSTIDDLINVLTPYGEVSFNNGILTFVGTDGCILTGNLVNGLGIKSQDVITTSKTDTTVVKEATSKTITVSSAYGTSDIVCSTATSKNVYKKRTGTLPITGTTKVGELTRSDRTCDIILYNTLQKQYVTVSVQPTDTIDDVKETLTPYGVVAIKNGKLSFTSNGIYAMSSDNKLFQSGQGNYSLYQRTISSSHYTKSVTVDTTLYDLYRWSSTGKNYTITITTNNTERTTITMNSTDTVGDLIGVLANYGISLRLKDEIHTDIVLQDGQFLEGSLFTNSELDFSHFDRIYFYQSLGSTHSGIVKERIITEDDRVGEAIGHGLSVIYIGNAREFLTYTVDSTKTFGEVFKELERGYRIRGMIDSEGHLFFESTGPYYIQVDYYYNITYTTIKRGETAVVTTITQKTVPVITTAKVNTSSVMSGGANGGTYTATATSKVTYGQLVSSIPTDASKRMYTIIGKSGDRYVFTVQENTTIGDVFSNLAAFDISATITDGKITVEATGDYFVEFANELADVYKLKDNVGYMSKVYSKFNNTSSKSLQISTNATLTSNTTLGELGLGPNILVGVTDAEGKLISGDFTSNNTMQDVMSWLAAYGISAFINDGVLYLAGALESDEDIIIMPTNWLNVDGENNGALTSVYFLKSLKLSTNQADYITTKTSTTLANTTSNTLVDSRSYSLLTSTKLKDIGITTAQTATVVNNGVSSTLTFSIDSTIDDMISTLAGYGIAGSVNGGKLTLTGTKDGYISSMSDGLKTALNLSVGSGNSYNTTTSTTGSNTLSTRQNHNVTYSADATTTITTAMGTGTITLNYQGTAYNVTVSTAKTIGDVMNELAGYGISGSLVNGVLKFQGTGDGYVTNWGSAFGLTGSSYSTTVTSTTITTGSNTLSNRQNHNRTYNADATTTITTVMGTGTINVRYEGNNYNVTVSAGKTIGDVMNELAGFGISGSLVNGVLKFTGTGDGYVTNWNGAFGLTGASYSTATTSTTITTGSNTLSNRQNHNRTYNAEATTTITTAMGTGTINVRYEGNNYNVTVSAGKTIGDVMNELAGFGISGSLVNGVLKFTGTGDGYVTNWNGAFGLTGASYSTATTSTTITTGSNTLSNRQNHNVTYDAQATTKISQTSAGKGTITVNYQGHNYNVTVSGDKTIGDVMNELAGYGISGSLQGGILKFQGTGDGYVTNWGSAFGLTGASYGTVTTSTTITTGSNTLSNRQNHNVTYDAQATTKISQTSAGLGTITVNYQGHTYNVTVSGDKTIGDVMNELAGYGISGSLKEGVLKFQGTGDGYVTNWGGAFGLTGASYGTVTTSTTITTGSNTLSNRQNHNVTYNANATTKMSQTSAGLGTMTVNYEGKTYYVTATADKTIGEILNELAGYGISGSIKEGVIKLQGTNDGYITNAGGVFGLTGSFYGTTTVTIKANKTSNDLSYTSANVTLTSDTKISAINGYSGGSGSLIIHKTDGTFVTISVDATKTLGEFFTQLSKYGLVGRVDDSGKVSIDGIGNVYMQQVSGGSNILTALKLSNVRTNVKTVTVNRTSDTLHHTITVAASGTTQLGNLQLSNGTGINFTGNSAALILRTTSDAGNKFVTINFSKTQSIYDVIAALANYGIDARIDSNGRFSMTSSTLTDFEISGALGTFLMGTYSKKYGTDTTYNTSTNLLETTTVFMKDSDALSTFGVTGGNIIINQEGVKYTVNVDTTQIRTVGDFRNLLSKYGFNSYIDDHGRLNVEGIGNSTLEQIAGGSNILDKFGLLDWTLGEITQNSDHLTDTEVITRRISMSDKLKDLTNSSGVNLGITAGQIYVYQDGTRSTLNIDVNDTLETLQAKLAQYGITVGISQNGQLYFDGNNDSYLTTNGISSSSASNILQKFGISGTWSTRYDSTSEKLDYTTTSNNVVTGSTKLKDLNGADGKNLGITTGAFYVYNSGVRTTEQIEEDMTVNDLMATLAKYGLVADIDENGSISVGAYNNTYLATSALSSANSNIVSTLFAQWDFVNIYKSNHLDIPTDEIRAITRDTKLSDINEGTYKAGYITVVKDGVKTNISLTADDTVGTLMDELALYGFESVINDKGQLMIKNTGDSLLQNYSDASKASNALTLLGIDLNNWINTNTYESGTLDVTKTSTIDTKATRDTLLSQLGVTTGEYYIYNNGVKYTAMISSDETIGSFMDTLKSFGIETSLVEKDGGSVLTIVGKGDSYLKKSTSTTNSSNVVEQLFKNNKTSLEYSGKEETFKIETTFASATEDTLVSYFDEANNKKSEGDLTVVVNGQKNTIKITADDTFGSLLEKFRALGIEATMSNGQIMLQSGYDTLTITPDGTTSNLLTNIKLVYKDDLGGYSASNVTVKSTTTNIEEKTLSVANYANSNTKLSDLNISEGTLTIYRDGIKAQINIDENDTFTTLQSRISEKFNKDNDVIVTFEDGYLKIYSKSGKNIEVGATSDSSNFGAITGIASDGTGVAKSARELYCVIGDSKITANGLFRRGNVKAGTFTVGDAVFTITNDTKLSDLISQINSSDTANATAFWDNVEGKLVIKSRTTGAALVNIEAGTSNFTDIMGFTTSQWNGDGSLKTTKMNIDTQEIGDNAKIKINGTTYTSTSNNITSDVTRIKGLTINLKGLTKDSSVTLKVERDKETLANAVSSVVDSYNELMKNVDEAIASDGDLKNESTLKLIRNQLRNLMTSSDAGTTVFRNLDSIGIGASSASGSNISTANSAIISLTFDKDKFLKAYEADQDAVKELIIGGANNKGVFTKVEDLVESTLKSVSGYFASTETSYTNKIRDLDKKITKANKEVDRYKARLEAKFQSMDMLIAQMQQQYSSFLKT